MSKNKVITILIICAIGFSALASYMIYHYMSPQRETIFVFNNSYSAGETFVESMVTPIQVDANAIANGGSTNIANHFVTRADYASVIRSGDSLKINVSEGMPLTTAMLSVTGGSTIEMNMASDAIAVSLPLDRFTGVTNDLKEGSRVNIYYTNNDQTLLIQQNKRILEVFKDGNEIVGVAVEENIHDSMELINAVNTGSIYLGLVDSTGYQSAPEENPSFSFISASGSSDDIDYSNFDSYLEEAAAYARDPAYESETEDTSSDAGSVTGGIEPADN